MVDELQQPLPESESTNPPVTPDIITLQHKKSNKNLWLILGILGIVVAVICLCSILCVVLGATSLGKGIAEGAPIESVLDSYMKYMEAKDVESAYALFSPRVQRQIPTSTIQELTVGNNYVLFEGYQSLSVQTISIGAVVNANPDIPQGTVAKVSGTISYEGDFQGTFNGTLEKVDGKWQIDDISVTVPPDKFQP
jgi:hypothetical protein